MKIYEVCPRLYDLMPQQQGCQEDEADSPRAIMQLDFTSILGKDWSFDEIVLCVIDNGRSLKLLLCFMTFML